MHAPYDKSIGIAAVLVQAKDEAARAWYLGQAGWLEVTAGGRTLWLPVGVVGGALDRALVFRPTDEPSAPPFFTAKLEAVRCVFACPRQWFSDQWRITGSTSIITISVSCACAVSSVVIVANTPIQLHRFQRL